MSNKSPEPRKPTVSVIIPCRNEVSHIINCLDSVLAQQNNGFELEVLVADGRSDDGTRALLDEYSKKNPKIRVIDNPQKITPTALNEAIKAAKGDIIVRTMMSPLAALIASLSAVGVIFCGLSMTLIFGFFFEYSSRSALVPSSLRPSATRTSSSKPLFCWASTESKQLMMCDTSLRQGIMTLTVGLRGSGLLLLI